MTHTRVHCGPPARPTISPAISTRLWIRSGPQCAVCSAWNHPCPACSHHPSAISDALVNAINAALLSASRYQRVRFQLSELLNAPSFAELSRAGFEVSQC